MYLIYFYQQMPGSMAALWRLQSEKKEKCERKVLLFTSLFGSFIPRNFWWNKYNNKKSSKSPWIISQRNQYTNTHRQKRMHRRMRMKIRKEWVGKKEAKNQLKHANSIKYDCYWIVVCALLERSAGKNKQLKRKFCT